MRLSRLLPAALALASGLSASASSTPPSAAGSAPPQAAFLAPGPLEGGEAFTYQSDISRLMKVVVSHLYNDRDVFVRELRTFPPSLFPPARSYPSLYLLRATPNPVVSPSGNCS